ncbi:metallophosphoesterase family protein [Clostridium tertium]|uniref:metallophosphoesterase family protein n=1 Tax=Clostridium tertium TaxID=1559 RepID=UPI0024B3A58C|nr:metallophosphoesterase [Clostridium tertium]MDI9218972.1 metallophosphoesterase [Clostridium tertium]
MIFLHLSDIHFLREYKKEDSGYNSIFNNMTNPIIQIKRVLEKVDKSTLDFIMITGDLVESGKSDDYRCLKENLDSLFGEIPYIVTLGNHDNKKEFYKGWFNEESKDEPYNTTMEIGDLKIISFDNSEYHNSNGIINLDRCKWLKNELEKSSKQDVILMLHHHLLKEQFNLPSVSFNREFEEIINKSKIKGIFSGHTHHPYKGIFAGKPYFTSGSLSFVGYDEYDGSVRFEEETRCNLCRYENGEMFVEVIDALEKSEFLTYVKF